MRMLKTKKAEPHHHGILLVDKPQGWTSHDVVAKLRGLARQRQIGHTGTLDPMATGMLVVCLGNATRLVEYMTGHDKTYEGEITLGMSTTTDDTEGDILERQPIPELSDALLRALESQFTGTISQRPPAFSAVKVAGRRAYTVARKGGDPALAPRPVQVHAVALRPIGPATLSVSVRCGAGTYIRGIARDIGEAMGSAAHLSALRRTAAGPFYVSDAWTLDTLQRLADAGRFEEVVTPPDDGITSLPAAIVNEEHASAIAHGRRVKVESDVESEALRMYTMGGELIGIGRLSGSGMLRPLKVLTL